MNPNLIKVLLPDGSYVTLSEWQDAYGLKKYSNQIGRYFTSDEKRFQKDVSLFGELVICSDLMRVLDGYRELTGPVSVNSFNRNADYQKKLTQEGFRTAKFSPHEVKLAADVDTPGIDELKKKYPKEDEEFLWGIAKKINRERAQKMQEAANVLGIKVRIGNEQYLNEKQTFIHVDVCPEFYAPGQPWHLMPHPEPWEKFPCRW